MARIRTIKPEFPQSESIGALSRDARLLFIQLWTIVDDEGRSRAASRMLASLLYPYDDDARTLIDGWLDELEGANCIRRYEVEECTYLEVVNWLKHQKIDKPSKSKIPAFVEGSRKVAKPREASATDLGPGPRTKERDQDHISGGRDATRPIDEPFEEFWKAYPKREGANPKKPAKAAFLAKLKAGATADEIVAGAKTCAVRDRDKVGTPFIPQAVKWLRDERWRDYAEQPSAAGSPSPGWRPGLPTTEELRAKYSREHDEQGKGIRLEQGASVDAGGPRLRGAESDVPRDRSGIGGTQKLGEILPRLGLDAAELPSIRARPDREVDSALPVAGMADDRHEGA